MPVTLKPEQRDAVFAQMSAYLDGMGDLETAIERGNEEECYFLGRRVLDGLRLIVDGGLGWRRRTVEPTLLTLPDEELRRIVGRLRMEAMAGMEATRDEESGEWDLYPAIKKACESAFDQLP